MGSLAAASGSLECSFPAGRKVQKGGRLYNKTLGLRSTQSLIDAVWGLCDPLGLKRMKGLASWIIPQVAVGRNPVSAFLIPQMLLVETLI